MCAAVSTRPRSALPTSGTLFDIAGKQNLRSQLNTQMEQPTFWDNQEKARQTIAQLKPLNGLLNPYQALLSSAEDLGVMADLAEEDPRAEPELESELKSAEKRLA